MSLKIKAYQAACTAAGFHVVSQMTLVLVVLLNILPCASLPSLQYFLLFSPLSLVTCILFPLPWEHLLCLQFLTWSLPNLCGYSDHNTPIISSQANIAYKREHGDRAISLRMIFFLASSIYLQIWGRGKHGQIFCGTFLIK